MSRALSQKFKEHCVKVLAMNLRATDYYLTVCPHMHMVYLSPGAQLRCGLCHEAHPHLKVTRDEVKSMADGNVPDHVLTYVESLM
jgi:hypothetical protein